jgi:hypothetical protein
MRFTTNERLVAAFLAVAICACAIPASAVQTTAPATVPTTAATTAPASTMPAGAVALVANVTSVKGGVQVRLREGTAWQPVTVGMRLEQGAEIRTGLRSAVQFTIGDDQTITLDRLGTVTVLQAYQSQGKAKTDLGLKYGRTRYDIKATDLQHESTIRSPGSTLAIRGTDVTYEDQAPWVPTAVSREGRAEFRNFRRQFVAFGGTRRASVAADKNSPAQQALTETKADPRGAFAGRTEAEDELNLTITSLGGADALVQQAVQDLLRGFTAGPDTSVTGVINVPGPLEFTLDWIPAGAGGGGLPAGANIDLRVTDPFGNTASAAKPFVGSGSAVGQHFGDDAGASGAGAERVAWALLFPPGTYTVQAVHQGGADAQVFVVGRQGQSATEIGSFGVAPDPPIVLKAGETFSDTITTTAASNRVARSARQRAARAERRQERQVAMQARRSQR